MLLTSSYQLKALIEKGRKEKKKNTLEEEGILPAGSFLGLKLYYQLFLRSPVCWSTLYIDFKLAAFTIT